MNKLQKFGGIAALGEAIIYICAFVFFGAFWNPPSDPDLIVKFAFLEDNQTVLSSVNFLMYIAFGGLLAVLVPALHQRLKDEAPNLMQIASLFGVVWITLVMASGMIANIGLAAVIDLSHQDPAQAMNLLITTNTVVEGLGGGNEVVGGLWVLLVSISVLGSNKLPTFLCYLGLFVGTVGVLTIYPAELLTEIFGVSQILWFGLLGLTLLKTSNQ